jgi:hypothetical protein
MITGIYFLTACTSTVPTAAPQQSPMAQAASDYQVWKRDRDADAARKQQQIAEIGVVQKKAVLAWIACQVDYAKRVASITSESPENIILATFSACASFENPIRKSIREMYRIGDVLDETDKFMSHIRAASTERLTKEIIEVRALMRSQK